jgi:hypothetical protein
MSRRISSGNAGKKGGKIGAGIHAANVKLNGVSV